MIETHKDDVSKKVGALTYEDGKIYFSKATERKVFFVLTLLMLVLGIFSKLGLF